MGSIRLTQVILLIATFLPFLAQAAVIPRGDAPNGLKRPKCRPIGAPGTTTTTKGGVTTTAVTTTTTKGGVTTTAVTTTTTKGSGTTTTTTTKGSGTTTTTTTKGSGSTTTTTTTTAAVSTTTTTTTTAAITTTTGTTTTTATTTTTTTTASASATPKYDVTTCGVLKDGSAYLEATDATGNKYKAYTSGGDGGFFMAQSAALNGLYNIKNGHLIDADIFESDKILAPATVDSTTTNPQIYFESTEYRTANGLSNDKEVSAIVDATCALTLSYGTFTALNLGDGIIKLGVATSVAAADRITLKFVKPT